MRILSEADRTAVMEYISHEPEYNLFIIGDIENFGLDGDIVHVAVNETAHRWDSLVMHYLDFVIVYSPYDDYDAESVARYIDEGRKPRGVSGKGSVINRLAPYLRRKAQIKYMTRCNSAKALSLDIPEITIRRVTAQDARSIVELFCNISEFSDDYSADIEKAVEDEQISLSKGGAGFGAFSGNTLVGFAGTAAENSQSAMIVGVATLPQWRGRGIASTVVSDLCNDCFSRGMRFLCLFYDNPAAGRIYHRIGFNDIGEYAMLSSCATAQ
ncbi:MAG: GNAT family N-acetyltransferase [Clostridia bacterium]